MNLLWKDLKYAARMLAKTPGFTAVALVTLTLAIGANTAIFSIVNGMLIRPLPFPDQEELVQLMRGFKEGGLSGATSVPKFAYWEENTRNLFDGVTAFDNLGSGFNMAGDGKPERIIGSRATHEFFGVFGATPAIGRGFRPNEDRPGAAKVVVLSHGLWTRRFAADRGIVGRTLQLNGEPYTVVGVAPEGFKYPANAELWTPFQMDRTSQDKGHYFEAVGRLKDGVSFEKAKATAAVVGKQYITAHPDFGSPDETLSLLTLRDRLYGRLRPVLLILLGAVGFVLLIACVNLANLQLARATARQREVAIRTILGARSSQIVRQLLTESLLLSVIGGLLGLALGSWILKPLIALSPPDIERLTPIGIDLPVLGFTFGLALLAGLLFGLVPAAQASRVDLNAPLKEGSTRSTGGVRGNLMRRILVVGQVALALIPLTGAVLLVKSFTGVVRTDPGFDPRNVLTLKLSLPEGRYGKPETMQAFSRDVVERVESLPGVKKASVAMFLPLEGGADLPFTIQGKYTGGMSESSPGIGFAQYRPSTAGYFDALGIKVTRGRVFTSRDSSGAPLVVLINEAAAKHYWPNENPLGQRIHIGPPFVPELGDPSPREIVGIVPNVREVGLEEEAPPIVYTPLEQTPAAVLGMVLRLSPMNLVVKSEREVPNLAAAVQKEIWAVDAEQPVNDVRLMEEIVSRSLGRQRFAALLLGGLALLALLLAGVGIYGVLSYLVMQRTREIGVRMALGASARNVLGMVVRQGFLSVIIGVAIGVAGAFALARFLGGQIAGLLAGGSATDPVTFVLAPAVLAAVALLASVIPAHRASQLDPLIALRRD
ncbi:MAG TPA: ABC transporter permease [Thermoanaerobaculia bacterium]|nr:ABC transporter permease [Thermoanaerobaculia bacterium]